MSFEKDGKQRSGHLTNQDRQRTEDASDTADAPTITAIFTARVRRMTASEMPPYGHGHEA